jgi:hypothetical protein
MSGDRPLLDAGNSNPHHDYGTGNDARPLSYVDQQSRSMIEKKLLRKLDLRVAFLVLIYIMNCVSVMHHIPDVKLR